ncbi:MAG TPA: type II secretion system F family protein [Verrucomicrobiae bacterium]
MVTPGQLNRRAQLYDQLGSMIAAGVPLVKALEMASRNNALRSSQKSILALIGHLQEGHTFTDSMTKVQGWLPEFDVALLSVGEESGRLDITFKLLARYYASRAKIIRDTISGLIITVMTLNVFLLVFPLGYLIGFVQGIMDNNFAHCLPFIIEKIVVYGALYGSVLFLIFACQGNRGEGWRAAVESIFRMIPILRTAIKYLALARLASALDALTNAGVSVIKSWELASAACGSTHLKREILEWTPQLETGVTPADMVNQIHYFPEMFHNLYHTAEISGKLDETLVRLHNYYEEEGFRTLQMFTRILNGTIYGIVVILVAINIIRFWMNYYGAALSGI